MKSDSSSSTPGRQACAAAGRFAECPGTDRTAPRRRRRSPSPARRRAGHERLRGGQRLVDARGQLAEHRSNRSTCLRRERRGPGRLAGHGGQVGQQRLDVLVELAWRSVRRAGPGGFRPRWRPPGSPPSRAPPSAMTPRNSSPVSLTPARLARAPAGRLRGRDRSPSPGSRAAARRIRGPAPRPRAPCRGLRGPSGRGTRGLFAGRRRKQQRHGRAGHRADARRPASRCPNR